MRRTIVVARRSMNKANNSRSEYVDLRTAVFAFNENKNMNMNTNEVVGISGKMRLLKRSMMTETINTNKEQRNKEIKKMLYRAKQRGFLELDVMVGEWAERTLYQKSERYLEEFSKVLDEENPDLFQWLTGQREAPKRMREENEAYKELKEHVFRFLDEKSCEKTRAKHGKEWVRGWNDSDGGNQ